MNVKIAQRRYVAGTSRGPQRAATLLAQMADLERGARISELREQRHFTQSVVAERVGVTLRGYQEWEAGGGIQWENAKKLAKVLGTTPDILMSGPPPAMPDIAPDREQLNRIEAALADVNEQVRLLRAETAVRDAEVLKQIAELQRPTPGSQRRQQR
jgi:transcriptional regulator with XRE-family HTH domain